MAETVFSVLESRIEDIRSAIVDAIVEGSAADYPEYKLMVGQIRGCDLATAIINEIAKNYEEEDDV